MKNRKRIISLLLISVLAAGLAGCGGSGESSTADTESAAADENSASAEAETEDLSSGEEENADLKTIVIATATSDGIMTDVARIAQVEGFFEDELSEIGYVPEYQGFAQAGPAINEAFASEDVDVAIYGDMPAITAKSNAIDIKIVASVNSGMDLGIVVGNDSGITSVEDLAGKQIAAGTGTVTYQYLANLLETNGMSIDDVELINTSTDGPSMLASDQIDGFVTQLNAALLYEEQGIGTVVLTSQGDEEISTQMLLAVRTDYLESDREAVTAVVKALYDAYIFAQENPDETYADLVTDYANEEIQRQVYEDITFESFDPAIDELTFTKTGNTEKFQEDNQLIAESVDLDDLIDSSITEEVSALYE